jgi:hypothetical protein
MADLSDYIENLRQTQLFNYKLTVLNILNKDDKLTKEQKIKLCEIIEPLQSRVEVVDAWRDILRNGLLSENGYLKLIKKHKL